MLSAGISTLLVAVFWAGTLQAQHGGAMSQGRPASSTAHSGAAVQHGLPKGFGAHRSASISASRGLAHGDHDRSRTGYIPYVLPDDEYWSGPADNSVANEPPPPQVLEPRDEVEARMREKPLPAQVIEIPAAANSGAAKQLPPTIFVLTNGERLESQRFLLTTSHLSVSVQRQERTIPLAMLDIEATLAANRERGIQLQIPADRNEISLSF